MIIIKIKPRILFENNLLEVTSYGRFDMNLKINYSNMLLTVEHKKCFREKSKHLLD